MTTGCEPGAAGSSTRSELRKHLWWLGQIGLDLDGYRTLRNDILEIPRPPASAGEIRRTTGLSGPAATGVIQPMTFEGVLLEPRSEACAATR